jgi:hypothetical protein
VPLENIHQECGNAGGDERRRRKIFAEKVVWRVTVIHKATGHAESKCRSWFWPSVGNQKLHVLHGRNQVVLNLYLQLSAL